MDPIASIAKNTFVLLVSRCVLITLGFVYTLYTARYLGTEGYGIISFALALSAIFIVFSDLGLGTLATREISRDRSLSSSYLSNLSLMKTLLIIVSAAAIVLFVNLSGYPDRTVIVVYIILIYSVLFSFVNLFYSIFQAYEKMEYMSIGAIINSIALLAGALTAIYLRLDIVGFSVIYCVSIGLVLAYCLSVYLTKFPAVRVAIDLAFVKKAIVEAWPLGAMSVCVILSFRVATIVLSMFAGDSAVGLYTAAFTLSDMSTIVPTILAASLFPIISRYHATSRALFTLAFAKSVKLLYFLAVPMALFVTIWAEQFIIIIYGSSFIGSVSVLQILIWSAATMYATMLLGTVFVTANHQMINLKISVVMTVITLLLDLLVIPVYGIYGAATVFLIVNIAGFIVYVYVLERLGYNIDIMKIYVVPTVGAVVAGAAYLIMTQLRLNLVLVTIVCLALYTVVVLAKGIESDDLRLFRMVIGPIDHIRGRILKH